MSYPTPILNLDFVNSKQLDPRIAYSRSSPATFFDRNGVLRTAVDNMPRFDHDPLTGVCKGLLVEPQVSFLDTYSEQFDNAAWVKTNASITPNAAIAPDGTLTADKLVEDTSENLSHKLFFGPFPCTVQAYTTSVFAKAAGRTRFKLTLDTSGTSGAIFDLSSGSIFATDANYTASIISYGNGWYRCSITVTTNAVNHLVHILPVSGTTTTYTGDGTSGIYIWGAKLYAGTGPTSYLPSVASSVTRAADIATVDLTQLKGAAGEALWSGSEGTIVVDAITAPSIGATQNLINLDNGSSTDRVILYRLSTGIVAVQNVIGSANQWTSQNYETYANSTRLKISMSFSAGAASISLNGASAVVRSGGLLPVINYMRVGYRADGTQQWSGTIRSIQLYNRRIADVYLPALSAL